MFKKLSMTCILVLFLTASIAAPPNQAEGEIVLQTEQMDGNITSKIYHAFERSPTLKNHNILVNTSDAYVILSGTVANYRQYEQAIIIVKTLSDIEGLNVDNLAVKNHDAPLNDLFITAQIKAALVKKHFFPRQNSASWPVSIKTQNAIVYISGHLSSNAKRKVLMELIGEIEGIQSIVSSVT